ncbi:MAG TPA: tetratricopeptide repeat protein [Phycisphaerae bacterium]|nr:tetratricopeptide repeat protein [Phycisphaerae bacterium]
MSTAFALLFVASSLFQQTTSKLSAEDIRRSAEIAQAQAGAYPTDAEIGPWLVNLARHQGHLRGRADARSNALHVLALLRAASRVSPDCADAHKWLYDIEQRLGRTQRSKEALTEYVRLRPDDDAAAIQLFRLRLEEMQSIEQRAAYAESELKRKKLSRPYQSELNLWLARRQFERGERDEAAKHLERALLMNPMNIEARELSYKIFGETQPELQRVEIALQLIAANPSQANLIWDLAQYLDSLSMHKRAQEWYNRAIEINSRADAGPIPADYWRQLAESYLASRDYEEAISAASEAINADADIAGPRLVRAVACRASGDTTRADADLQAVAKLYRDHIQTIREEKDYDAAADVAWFFCVFERDARLAMEMSEFAMSPFHPSDKAKIARGCALNLNSRREDAIATLEPLVATDPFAACEFARIQFEQNQRDDAMKTLTQAAGMRSTGIGRQMIAELITKEGGQVPSRTIDTKITAVLDKFRRDVFDYHKRPGDFLRFTIKSESNLFDPTAPIRATFRMENIGAFPITFGEGYMARPLVSVSVKLGGDNGRQFDNYLTVLMSSRPTLLPGDAFEDTISLDVGEVRTYLTRHIDQPIPIAISAMFDPIWDGGMMRAGLGTIAVGPFNTVRGPLDASPAGVDRLIAAADANNIADRVRAADRIGALLATIDDASSQTKVAPELKKRLDAALARLLTDSAWQVKSHALVAAGWSPLNDDTTTAAAPQVRASQPIVKLLAVRLFANQHGSKFREVLEEFCSSDPDESVRLLAASYLPESAQAAIMSESPVKTTVSE